MESANRDQLAFYAERGQKGVGSSAEGSVCVSMMGCGAAQEQLWPR